MTADGRLSDPAKRVPGLTTAWLLSLAGALPFVASALGLLVGGQESLWFHWFVDVMRTYGAVILSFVGGIRWGAALRDGRGAFGEADAPAGRIFILSVLPSLAAWFSLFLDPVLGLAFLAATFALQGVWDAFSGPPAGQGATTAQLPRWFVRLRVTITVIAVASLVIALIAVA